MKNDVFLHVFYVTLNPLPRVPPNGQVFIVIIGGSSSRVAVVVAVEW